ncbi:MAG: protein kinase domain-containing protein [Thermoanaerobaculia bacterium]
MRFTPGTRIGPYEILGSLGAGGMGEVYRARDEKLGREIALKILPPDLAASAEGMRRFEQEARAASALNHQNIVTIYEINRIDDIAFIAMELVEGQDLRTLATKEPLSLKLALRIATKIADGLAAAHEKGIVHRDLKPDNVMITPEGFVKILDFGLAKQIRTISADDATIPHTSPGAVFGTVGYMSPEQATGREMDYRADQFSFGVVLYEMLTRIRPFDRDSKPETMTAIIRDEPPLPSTINEEISYELDRIIARCLAKNPRDRYASTRDLARDLRELRDGFTHGSARIHSISMRPQRRIRRQWSMAIAGAVIVALLAIGAVMWQRRGIAHEHIASVAVLPFRDLSETPEGRVLADGISEMVASRLAETRELRVAAPFEGAPLNDSLSTRDIARRRGVDALIRGSVQRDGNSVRVSYSLIDGATGETIEATNAMRAANELFALEDVISEDLLRALGRTAVERTSPTVATLAPEDQKRFIECVGLLRGARDEASVDRAIASLEGILRNARESGRVNALLARALLHKASLTRRPALIEQATVYAARGVALNANDPESHVTLGRLHNASGRYADAVKSFERALALRPDHVDAMVGLGEAYSGSGRAADADRTFRAAIAKHPDNHGAYMEYGAFCFEQGRYADAVQNFKRATELVPQFAHAYSNLGGALQAAGRYDEAETAFQKSLAIQPTAQGFSNLGTLQFSRGRYAESVKSYEKATNLAPADFVMWANLGDACRWAPGMREQSVHAFERAIATARDSLQLNPNDAYTRSVIALSLAKSGKTSEAQDEIRKALELDPTSRLVLYKAAVIAVIRGANDSAMSWIERAIAAGYPASELASDPELATIRDLPSFRTAVKSRT